MIVKDEVEKTNIVAKDVHDVGLVNGDGWGESGSPSKFAMGKTSGKV